MTHGLVSILIPVYNRQDLIGETIQSALQQTHTGIEVVVVDNASSDATWDRIQSLAASDPRVRPFRNTSNLGPVRNWVECARHARGEIAKILWSDDLIAPDYLARTLALLEPGVGFVYSAVRMFGNNKASGSLYLRNPGKFSSQAFINAALAGWDVPYSPGCAVLRTVDLRRFLLTDVPNRVGSDFASHAIGNDLLLLLLTADAYPQLAFAAEPLSLFRDHPGSISASSRAGRLHFHYDLVKAYFAERTGVSAALRRRFNAALQIDLWRFGGADWGIHSRDDFYPNGGAGEVDWPFLALHALRGAARIASRRHGS